MSLPSKVQWVIRDSESDAREFASKLQKEGWEVYHETVPLSGQEGFYCVKSLVEDGDAVRHIKNVVWNMYEQELYPVVMDATCDQDVLSFLWQHASHPGFGYFEWSSGEAVGFVCHCNHQNGRSIALKISEAVQETVLGDAVLDLLAEYYDEVDDDDLPD